MSKENENKFFTKKHNTLLNISKVAKILAIVIFIALVPLLIYTYSSQKTAYEFSLFSKSCSSSGQEILLHPITSSLTYWEKVRSDPPTAYKLIRNLFNVLSQYLMYGITLLGISYGLNMIVETDLNYRLKAGEVKND
jgi:hypothetical protein